LFKNYVTSSDHTVIMAHTVCKLAHDGDWVKHCMTMEDDGMRQSRHLRKTWLEHEQLNHVVIEYTVYKYWVAQLK